MAETTEDYYKVSTSRRKKKGEKVRTIVISKGVKALYGVKNKVVITYLFDKDRYTTKKAKEWVEKHEASKTHAILMDIDALMVKREELLVQYKKEVIAALEE